MMLTKLATVLTRHDVATTEMRSRFEFSSKKELIG